jgi:hypothetical protein
MVAAACLIAAARPAASEPAGLEGSWSGGGTVVLPSGERERARCRASFRRESGNTFAMSATCATPSARISQSAALARTSANRYSGEFYNPEYAIAGSIAIIVSGNKLTATLSGGGGSALFHLSR